MFIWNIILKYASTMQTICCAPLSYLFFFFVNEFDVKRVLLK